MKKLALVLSMAFMTLSFAPVEVEQNNLEVVVVDSEFCNGWDAGYCSGYKSVKGDYAPCPPVAPCPPETVSGTYDSGYSKGYTAGRKRAER